jgi:hypothetical protein
MGLLHFVKEENPPRMGVQDLPKPSGHTGFIPKEKLHAVEVLEFRHVEAMKLTLSPKRYREHSRVSSVFPTPVGPRNKNGTQGLV